MVAAVSAERVLSFPSAAVRRIWDRYLLPAKRALASPYGIRLAGVEVRVDLGSPSHRRFGEILVDRGFKLPAHRAVRFLVSDNGWDSIPEKSSDNPLMILVAIGEALSRWSGHLDNPAHPLLDVNEESLPRCLADVALDLSLANSHFYDQIISKWSLTHGGINEFFNAKAKFARAARGIKETPLPYVPLSWIARQEGDFGTQGHLKGFVDNWDDFLFDLDADAPILREHTCAAICRYPNFGGQLSPDLIRQAIERLDKGSHVLFVQRKSMKMRESPSYRNEAHAAYSSMTIRGNGGKPFGFFDGTLLPEPAKRLVDKGAAYALRIFVGEN